MAIIILTFASKIAKPYPEKNYYEVNMYPQLQNAFHTCSNQGLTKHVPCVQLNVALILILHKISRPEKGLHKFDSHLNNT